MGLRPGTWPGDTPARSTLSEYSLRETWAGLGWEPSLWKVIIPGREAVGEGTTKGIVGSLVRIAGVRSTRLLADGFTPRLFETQAIQHTKILEGNME